MPSPQVIQLVSDLGLTYDDLTFVQRKNLEIPNIRRYITDTQQILNLTNAQRNNLDSLAVRKLIDDDEIEFTLEQALGLTFVQRKNLEIPNIRRYITDTQQILNLTNAQRNNLDSLAVRKLIDDDEIEFTLEQALGLTFDQRNNLDSLAVRKLIDDDEIEFTLEQALGLTFDQRNNLDSLAVRKLIDDDEIEFTLEQALGLTFVQRKNLEIPNIRRYITDTQQILNLTFAQRNNLDSLAVRKLIDDDEIEFTLEQALGLTFDQRKNLEIPNIRRYITDTQQILNLTNAQRNNLDSLAVRKLIDDDEIEFTLEQALGLTFDQRNNLVLALDNLETRQRLRNGELTIQDIIGNQRPHTEPQINNTQSTHTASVHKSVSKSATNLLNRYGLMIDGDNLENTIEMVKSYVNSLPDDLPDDSLKNKTTILKNKAAKTCIKRITAPDYTFTDQTSQVSVRQLLALAFLAIHDDGKRTGDLTNAKNQFVKALYEIQRGYNLSETGVDLGEKDKPICTPGTFNKIIEKLVGFHSDVEQIFITKETASLKLPIVVKEETFQYLSKYSHPKTQEEFQSFMQLLKKVEDEGVSAIWDKITEKVKDRMFEEFGSLYYSANDEHFVGFIDAGQYVDLGTLPTYQKEISESPVYYEWCNQQARSLCGFFKPREKEKTQQTTDTKAKPKVVLNP